VDMEFIAPNTTKEEDVMFSITKIQPVAASGAGALSGFECKCSCGMVLRSSLETLLRNDAAEHSAYHTKRGQ
jgi:hypothetical protein